MKRQADTYRQHVHKFAAFMKKNTSMHFHLKQKVIDVAVTSPLLYGCEGSPSGNIKSVNQQYTNCVKLLLGVRKTTPHTLYLLELDLPELLSTVHKRQGTSLRNFLAKSSGDEPLA